MPHSNISATVTAPQFSAATLSRDEYYRLAESGIFAGKRVELIHGEILTNSPMNEPHAQGILLALAALRLIFPSGYTLRPQLPLPLDAWNEPEPDLVVVAGGPRDPLPAPAAIILVLEVADHSLEFDTTIKAALYAAAAIPEYWMVDLRHRQVLVHRQPQAAPGGEAARYQSVTRHGPAEAVLPAAAPPGRPPIPVADLLP